MGGQADPHSITGLSYLGYSKEEHLAKILSVYRFILKENCFPPWKQISLTGPSVSAFMDDHICLDEEEPG